MATNNITQLSRRTGTKLEVEVRNAPAKAVDSPAPAPAGAAPASGSKPGSMETVAKVVRGWGQDALGGVVGIADSFLGGVNGVGNVVIAPVMQALGSHFRLDTSPLANALPLSERAHASAHTSQVATDVATLVVTAAPTALRLASKIPAAVDWLGTASLAGRAALEEKLTAQVASRGGSLAQAEGKVAVAEAADLEIPTLARVTRFGPPSLPGKLTYTPPDGAELGTALEEAKQAAKELEENVWIEHPGLKRISVTKEGGVRYGAPLGERAETSVEKAIRFTKVVGQDVAIDHPILENISVNEEGALKYTPGPRDTVPEHSEAAAQKVAKLLEQPVQIVGPR
jgi:hypothetical protein